MDKINALMRDRNNEDLLENACDALARVAGLRLETAEAKPEYERLGVDAVARAPDYPAVRFALVVRKWVQHANLGAIAARMKDLPLPGVLVADYINPRLAARLREAKVQFMDIAGNAYIDAPPVYVYVRGNRPETGTATPGRARKPHRAFTAKGLRIVYAFLCVPELAQAPYREIANRTGVAHGTVGEVVADLKRQGFLINPRKGRGRRLVRYGDLLEQWIPAYPLTLRPKPLIGRFATADEDRFRNIDIADYNACWGGEVAARHYTGYLRPEITTIYIPGNDRRLLTAMRLYRDEHGKIEVLEKFWNEQAGAATGMDCQDNHCTPPLLTYADLVATGDARNLETAGMIHDQYIATTRPDSRKP